MGKNLISWVTTFYIQVSSFQQNIHKSYKETGKHNTFEEKNKATEIVPEN